MKDIENHPPHPQNLKISILFSFFAALNYALMGLCSKFIGDGASTNTILFSRFFISFLLLLPWLIQEPRQVIYTTHPLKLILRGVFTLSALGCFFYSLKSLSLTNALLLNNSFPLFVPLVILCLGGKNTSPKVWMGIVIGFLGIVLVLKPDKGLFNWMGLIALASGILAAISVVIIRSLTKSVSIIQILFYNFFIASLLTGVFLPFSWQDLTISTLWLLLGVGFFGALYQVSSTIAFAKGPVRLTSPLMFLTIVFGALGDCLFWQYFPDALTQLGILLVILGGILTIYFGRK